MKKNTEPMELLAPAGSYESMQAAYHAGADAVYMGGPRFGARAFADNPDDGGLLRAIDYTHLRGKKLYLTVNTLLKNAELDEALYDYIKPLYEAGLDAVILQDLGVFRFLREAFPGLPLHGSTQMTVCGPEGAALLKAAGLKRLVLPRELSLSEIRQIYERTGLDLEVFIHGALCYCYSGQCLMSSFLGARSGNRGRCAQPCRLPYEGGSFLNMRDLCALDLLPALKAAGVRSLKIEGRMKSPLYTAGVVSVYRKYLDLLEAGEPYQVRAGDKKRLFEIFNRGEFTDGYFKKHNGKEMINPAGKQNRISLPEEAKKEIEEAFLSPDPVPVTGSVFVEEGQALSLLAEKDGITAQVSGAAVQTAERQPLGEEQIRRQIGKTGDSDFVFSELSAELSGRCFVPVSELNALRRNALEALREALLAPYRRRMPEQGAEKEPGAAKAKTGEEAGKRPSGADPVPPGEAALDAAPPRLSVLVNSPAQLEAALGVREAARLYLPADYLPPQALAEAVRKVHEAGKEAYYALPFVFREKTRSEYEKPETLALLREASPDGVLLRSLDELAFWTENKLPGRRLADAGLYTWNRGAEAFLLEAGAQELTLPLELHEKDYEDAALLPREQVIYGRVPLMISAQCVQRTREGCLQAQGRPALEAPRFTALTDRTGTSFLCESCCRFCLGVIYNAVPLYLGDIARPEAGWRIQLTDESGEETARLLAHVANALRRGEKPARPAWLSITRGNYRRGVQ